MKSNKYEINNDENGLETDFRFIGETLRNNNHSKANILFIPGIGCEFADHQKFKELLVSYNYYAINLPAHGNSNFESYDKLSLKDMANYVLNYIQNKELDSLILIGHGTSCAVVALLNKYIPENIIGNVLVSPIDSTFISDTKQIRDVLIPRLDEQISQLLRLSIYDWDKKSYENSYWNDYKFYKLDLYKKNYKALNVVLDYYLEPSVKTSIENLYNDLYNPTLVVYGQSDGLLRVEESMKNIQRLIKDVSISTIPLSGNQPFMENPNNYYNNVISFIDYTVENYNYEIKENNRNNN